MIKNKPVQHQIHVCLISDQPMPNLVPLFLEKPDKALLLVSPEMKAQADRLKNIVQPHGIAVEIREIASAYDFGAMQQTCEKIITNSPNAELTLNVTGGTKIAALAAFQSFYFNNRRIVYLDTFHNMLVQLAPENDSIPVRDNLVKVRDCLRAYGMNPLSGKNPAPVRRPGLHDLARLLTVDSGLLGRLNNAIARCGKNPAYATLDVNDLGPGADELVSLLEGCGVAGRVSSTGLNIPSREKIFFCRGGWLEEYVYWRVKDLGLRGLDSAMNVKVEWDGKGRRPTENEFDVLFTHVNRLHLISCKAGNPERETASGSRATEALNELDALADRAGGIFGRAMLVSARRLSDYDRERAQKMKIFLVEGETVNHLRDELLRWIEER
ncbi:MAG: hypothetical protein BM485_01985 [Desulfobulbaceae bacterium DB1]|nr:MAG: hypothetical protein BM485_01985 [Desulfobulbaceae bacterium DB1]